MRTLREMAAALWDVVLVAAWCIAILLAIGLGAAILDAIRR